MDWKLLWDIFVLFTRVALFSWGPSGPRWDRLFHGVKH